MIPAQMRAFLCENDIHSLDELVRISGCEAQTLVNWWTTRPVVIRYLCNGIKAEGRFAHRKSQQPVDKDEIIRHLRVRELTTRKLSTLMTRQEVDVRQSLADLETQGKVVLEEVPVSNGRWNYKWFCTEW